MHKCKISKALKNIPQNNSKKNILFARGINLAGIRRKSEEIASGMRFSTTAKRTGCDYMFVVRITNVCFVPTFQLLSEPKYSLQDNARNSQKYK